VKWIDAISNAGHKLKLTMVFDNLTPLKKSLSWNLTGFFIGYL